MLLNILVVILITAFVTLIVAAYFYENKIARSEAYMSDKRIVTQKDFNAALKLENEAGYKKGYVDGGLDAKKGFARMMRDYPNPS